MRKGEQKKKVSLKQKAKKLKLTKETIKDLEPQEDTRVKGGRHCITSNDVCSHC